MGLPRSIILKRVAIGMILLLAIGLVAGPYLVAWTTLRDRALQSAMPPMQGAAASREASLGWLSPARYENVKIRLADGSPLVSIETLGSVRPLWKLCASPADFGRLCLHGVRLEVVAGAEGNSVDRLALGPLPHSALLELHQVAVSVGHPLLHRAWELGPMDGQVEVHAASCSGGQDQLVMQPGTRLDHAMLTPAMGDDLLRFFLPILVGAPRSVGEFSVDFDQWRFPIQSPRDAAGSARLTVHRLEVDAGPLAKQLAELAHLPPVFQLVAETTIAFEMAQGRIAHRDAVFAFSGLTLRTGGSVGLDETLDLCVEVEPKADRLPERLIQGLFPGRSIRLHIGGTLSRPEFDLSSRKAIP